MAPPQPKGDRVLKPVGIDTVLLSRANRCSFARFL